MFIWRDRNADVNRTSPGRFAAARPPPGPPPRAASRAASRARSETRTMNRSQPTTPMTDRLPMSWFVRDIDIGDRGGTGGNGDLYRPRSRHDCHFALGSPLVIAGPTGNFVLLRGFLFPLSLSRFPASVMRLSSALLESSCSDFFSNFHFFVVFS